METFLQDVRFAVRTLRKRPAFTFIAILTLALGIGANSAVFSVVDSVLLAPLPFRNADRLAMIWDSNPELAARVRPAENVAALAAGGEREPGSGRYPTIWPRRTPPIAPPKPTRPARVPTARRSIRSVGR